MSRWQESISETLYEVQGRIERLEQRPTVKFKRLHKDAIIPKYMTKGAAGMDLVWDGDYEYSDYSGGSAEMWVFYPEDQGAVIAFGTGLAIELPPGYEAQVRPRSGMSRRGLIVVNSPGTIDDDFRGEIFVLMHALSAGECIEKGDRIAQLIIAPVAQATIEEVEELSQTERGAGGCGSTGR